MTRAGLRPMARQTRAYFAPVDRVNGPMAIFDPSKDSGLQLDAPPAPWIDLGWIENFRRTSTTQIEALAAGVEGAVSAQARHGLGARVDFEFRDWGKLQMALAGGAEHMNVLATDASASRAGSGGIPLAAVPLLAGSTAAELVLGAGAVSAFQTGDLVACDLDYAQQVGYVGTGISAAYVKNPVDVRQDANYVRRVTFNVGRVAQITQTSLLLTQALPGGAPAAGAAVQKVIAFVDREGGVLPATVVGLVCGGRGIWRPRVFLLSDIESVHGESGVGTGEPGRDSKADRRTGVASFVHRAANSGQQRRSSGALLPELFPGEWSGGLLVA